MINSYNFYKTEIKTFITPPVIIGNKTYEITDGNIYLNGKKINPGIGNFFLRFKILRLAYFSIQARINPLFGLEGQDLDELNHSIDLIQSSNENLPVFKNIGDKNFIQDSMIPTRFLLKLKDLEATRRSLTEIPSPEIATKYNKLLEDTISSYLSDLRNLKQIANRIQESDSQAAQTDIYFLGGSSNISSYINLFDLLESNGLSKKAQLTDRVSCYMGNWKKCESLKNVFYRNLPAENIVNDSKDNYSNFDQFSSTYGYQYNIITSFLKKQETKYSYYPKPIIGIRTNCFGSNQSSNYSFFLMTVLHSNNESIFKPRLINNLFFFDLSKINSSYYDPLRKKGYQYLWQPETNFYECPDLNYQSKLISYNAIVESLSNKSIFKDIATDDENLKQIKLAENVLSNDIVNEDEFNIYFRKGAQLLSKNSEIELSKTIDRQKILDFEKLLNIYKQNSARLSKLIISGWKQNINFQKMIKENGDKMARNRDDPAYFFVRRSAPAIYFLTANATVTGVEPQFFDKIWLSIPDTAPIENLFTLKTSSKDEIVNIMSDSDRILELNKNSQKKR